MKKTGVTKRTWDKNARKFGMASTAAWHNTNEHTMPSMPQNRKMGVLMSKVARAPKTDTSATFFSFFHNLLSLKY